MTAGRQLFPGIVATIPSVDTLSWLGASIRPMTTTASVLGPRYTASGTVDGRDFYVTADNRTALLRQLPLHWHFPALTVGDHASIRFNGGVMRVERVR